MLKKKGGVHRLFEQCKKTAEVVFCGIPKRKSLFCDKQICMLMCMSCKKTKSGLNECLYSQQTKGVQVWFKDLIPKRCSPSFVNVLIIAYMIDTLKMASLGDSYQNIKSFARIVSWPWHSPASLACRRRPWAARPSRQWSRCSTSRPTSRSSLPSMWSWFRRRTCTFLLLSWRKRSNIDWDMDDVGRYWPVIKTDPEVHRVRVQGGEQGEDGLRLGSSKPSEWLSLFDCQHALQS